MAAKLSAEDLLAAADELPPEERRALAEGIRHRPELVGESEEEEIVAEAAMTSTVRMLDSSRDLIGRVLHAAERVNDELAQGWF